MSEYDKLKLDNQLCFSLYALSREVIKMYQPVLSKYNLTYTQYVTMLAMWELEKAPFKVSFNSSKTSSNIFYPPI